jgi:predicted amidophosphoribosyltransferase
MICDLCKRPAESKLCNVCAEAIARVDGAQKRIEALSHPAPRSENARLFMEGEYGAHS